MILPTAYFAPVEWYKVFLTEDCQVELFENFPKQTYRNRCMITSPNGAIILSVPICHVEHKQLTRDVEISYQQHWRHQHKIALLSAYKRTPYFDYYQDYIFPIYDTQYKYLKDLNDHCNSIVIDLMSNKRPIAINPLPKTSEWKSYNLEQYWGEGKSVLDLLMEYGPMTAQYIKNYERN